MPAFHIVRVAINDHHVMYDEVIGALAAAFAEMGHRCTTATNEIAEGAVNILVGSTIFAARLFRLESRLRGIPYILYQLEQLDETRGLLRDYPDYEAILSNAARIWDYAPSSTDFLRGQGAEYLPPAFHPSLEKFHPARAADIDVIFAGSGRPRRMRILEALSASGARVVNLDGVYGQQRDELLARAKIVLNIHAWDDLKILETVRLSYLLANRCFVISETGDHDPYDGGVIYANHSHLVETCLDWLRRPAAEREAVAERGCQAVRAKPLTGALKEILTEDLSVLRAGRSAHLIWPAPRDHSGEAAALQYWSREGAGIGTVFASGDGQPGAGPIRLLILGRQPSYEHHLAEMQRWLGQVEDCGAMALLGVGTDPGATRLHQEILLHHTAMKEICSTGSLRIFGKR